MLLEWITWRNNARIRLFLGFRRITSMALSDDPLLDVSTAQEGQNNKKVAPTPSEKTLVAQSIISSQAPRPVVRRRRRLLTMVVVVLFVVLLFVSARLISFLTTNYYDLLIPL